MNDPVLGPDGWIVDPLLPPALIDNEPRSDAGAAFVLNGPAGLTAGQTVRFRYFGVIDWWVRV